MAEIEPALKQERLKGAVPLYYDCATDDARLTLETALDATNCRRWGVSVPYAKPLTSFLKTENGRVRGAVIKDEPWGELKEIEAGA